MLEQDQGHDGIMINIKNRIENVKHEINKDIDEAANKLDHRSVAIGGPLCASFVAGVRENALNRCRFIKSDIYQTIIENLIREEQVHGLHALQELEERLTTLKDEKSKIEADQAQVEHNIKNLHDYDKFLLYGEQDGPQTQKIGRKKEPAASSGKVLEARKGYIRKRNFGYVFGAIMTVIFAAMDFSIIYSVFLASNMGPTSAFITAFFASVALDAPPYILGVVWTAKSDQRQLRELQGDSAPTKKEEKHESWQFNVVIALLCIVIFLFFMSYLLVRIFLFLGGGDFDVALHFLVNREFNFDEVSFQSADLISTFVPFVTSAMAFALGLLTSASYVEYVKRMIVIINDDLQSKMKEYQHHATECDGKIQNLNSEIDTKRREIWTLYYRGTPLPEEEPTFRQEVATAFQEWNLKRYIGTYKTCCSLLRNAAESALLGINQGLAPHVTATMQQTVNSMPFSDRENDILSEIWVTEDGKSQRKTTVEQIQEIETMVQSLSNPHLQTQNKGAEH